MPTQPTIVPAPASPRRLMEVSGRIPVAMVAACPFPANRGTPIRIQQMGEALNNLGFDVHVVAYHLGQDRPVNGVTVHRIKPFVPYQDFGAGPNYRKLLVLDPLLLRLLCRVVRRHRIRVIHAHHFEGAICALAARELVGGVQVVYDAHTSLRDELLDYPYPVMVPRFVKKVVSDLLDGIVPRWSDHVVTVSDTLRDFIAEQGVPRSRITVVPMAVNVGEFPVIDRTEARQALGLPDVPTVLYTGNLAPFQGIDHLLRAMQKVVAERPTSRLVIVGKPTASCRRMIEDLRLGERVSLAGERPFAEVRQYLAAADVVVLPRDNCPGFPLKLLNYMAAGRAIVAFHGSAKEVLRHSVNGWVVPDGDEPGFAAGIIRFLDDPRFSEQMGVAARDTVGSFNPREMEQRLGDLYRSKLLVGSPARGDVLAARPAG